VLFKHSPLCGTSSRALRQVARFAAERPETPVFMVDVVENRDVSRYITEKFGIRHQSPQVIVTHDGAPTWNGSHFRVSMRAIRREVDRP
jgi:bacillithiol system protein YtxJ